MDKDMRQRCILCERAKPYVWHQSATTFICADCRADAARGRAFKKYMENKSFSFYVSKDPYGTYVVTAVDVVEGDEIGVGKTLDAALEAAGLMEGEQ